MDVDADVGRFGSLTLLSPASATITSFGIDYNPLTFGSDPTSTVRLFYPNIAPTHALIEFVDSKAFLVIQGKGGVEVDGCRVREGRVALGNGDDFVIQGKRFKFDYPPKALRKFMDPSSPVKGSGRRVRLSMVRAAIIDSPTPGAKVVQLGGGDVMLREEGKSEELARQDSPYALHQKSQTPPSVFPSLHTPSPIHSPSPQLASSLYPSLPEFEPPPPSPIRPPSPQKDSLRGRVLVRRAMLAEEEQEEMEVAGGLFAAASDSESDRSSDGAVDESMSMESEPDEMMVDSEPDMIPESEVELPSEPDDDEIMEISTPKAFKFTRPSIGAGRPSLGGGPPLRPERPRPSFKLDLDMVESSDALTSNGLGTPMKEEQFIQKDLWNTPRRKKTLLTDAEKKAIQERRKSALATPDAFFAGRVPGLGPSLSPVKLFGVKEEPDHGSIFSSPSPHSPSKASPNKRLPKSLTTPSFNSPAKKTSIFSSSAEDILAEESEGDDPQILLAKMKEEMEIMRARRSPKKEGAAVPLDVVPMDITPETPATDFFADSNTPNVGASRRSVSPRKLDTSPAKNQESPSPIPSLDLRTLLSPRKSSRPPSPPREAEMEVDQTSVGPEIIAETVDTMDVEIAQELPPVAKPPSKRKKPLSAPLPVDEHSGEPAPGPGRRTTRASKASTSTVVAPEIGEKPPSKKKNTRAKKVVEEPSEVEEEDVAVDEVPKKTTTRSKRAPTPVTDEPRVTRGKKVATPAAEEPRTRTRTRTKMAEIENEEPEPEPEPEPVPKTRRTRTRTEPEVEISDVEEPKKNVRKTRARSKTEPIPEEVEALVMKTRTRAKKDDVKEEEEEPALPRTRTRTRTRTGGK